MRYEVSILTDKKLITTKANSLREVKSLISGLSSDLTVFIEDLKTNTTVLTKYIKYWSYDGLVGFPTKRRLARGIYKSGFIKT